MVIPEDEIAGAVEVGSDGKPVPPNPAVKRGKGRPPGSKNKKTLAREALAAQVVPTVAPAVEPAAVLAANPSPPVEPSPTARPDSPPDVPPPAPLPVSPPPAPAVQPVADSPVPRIAASRLQRRRF